MPNGCVIDRKIVNICQHAPRTRSLSFFLFFTHHAQHAQQMPSQPPVRVHSGDGASAPTTRKKSVGVSRRKTAASARDTFTDATLFFFLVLAIGGRGGGPVDGVRLRDKHMCTL